MEKKPCAHNPICEAQPPRKDGTQSTQNNWPIINIAVTVVVIKDEELVGGFNPSEKY